MKSVAVVGLFALGLMLSACTTTSSVGIKSVRYTSYNRMPERILFVANFGEMFGGSLTDRLSDTISKSLSECGRNAAFEMAGPLQLNEDLPQKIKDFSPDAMITIGLGSQSLSGGFVYGASYSLELMDMSLKTVVWKAEMQFYAGRDRIPAFAANLIDRLKKDGILPADCNVPKPA